MIPLSTGRIIRASTTHEEGLIKKEQVRNSLKYAADAPLSTEVKIAMVVAGLATFGIGALLILGIREVYLLCKAEEKQKEQAELVCKIIYWEIKTDVNGHSSITVQLSTGNKVVCTERPGGLFISTNGGEELRHPTLDKIKDLQDFFKEDMKKNIDLYKYLRRRGTEIPYLR